MVLSSWGFSEPLPAAMKVANPNNPTDYNSDYLKSPIDIKIPAPKSLPKQPIKNIDKLGYKRAAKKLVSTSSASEFNKTYLKIPNEKIKLYPVIIPYTKLKGLAELRKSRGSAPDEQKAPPDYMARAITIRDLYEAGSVDYEYWTNRIFLLGQLDDIKKIRLFTNDEQELESSIIDEINKADIPDDEQVEDPGDISESDSEAESESDDDQADREITIKPTASMAEIYRVFYTNGVVIANPAPARGRRKMDILNDFVAAARNAGFIVNVQ